MKRRAHIIISFCFLFSMLLWALPQQKEPHIGYVYPAGGSQGNVCKIFIGGQFLRGVITGYVSGTDISLNVINYYRPLNNFTREQRLELRRLLNTARQAYLAENGISDPAFTRRANTLPSLAQATNETPVTMPEHPLLENLEHAGFKQLQHVMNEFSYFGKKQKNAQLAEMVAVEISIPSNAVPGFRDIRLNTPLGLSNPVRFYVGILPEVLELEPNNPIVPAPLPPDPPLNLPVVINGQIRPGDIDRFRFNARKGQQIVIETRARSLIPYLADAVPGWFQPVLALYDDRDNELAFSDDYCFDPDPVLMYTIPRSGVFQLEIRDAIYRGREDFVYRLSVGELPFISSMFPLGGQTGSKTVARLKGWNLSVNNLLLDTRPGSDHIRQTFSWRDTLLYNSLPYAVDDLPEYTEMEPNNASTNAPWLTLPRMVNGTVAVPGDIDIFHFEGRAGKEIVAEVLARRLNSPLDSLLTLTDSRGVVIALNDDSPDKESGLQTHHADSYLRSRLPHDGLYYLLLSDARQHGGPAYGYRLRLSAPRPDFALRVTPSSLNLQAGCAVPLTVHLIRKDGFDGAVDIHLKNAPDGFALHGNQVPPGCDRIRMTLSAPGRVPFYPIPLQLEGRALINDKVVKHPAVPAEDMMQAFLYRHLVPFQSFMVSVKRNQTRTLPAIQAAASDPVLISTGGTARIVVNVPRNPVLSSIQFELSDPPAGISLGSVTPIPGGRELTLQADATAVPVSYIDNLIIKAYVNMPKKGRDSAQPQKNQLVSLGVLPAIPIKITTR